MSRGRFRKLARGGRVASHSQQRPLAEDSNLHLSAGLGTKVSEAQTASLPQGSSDITGPPGFTSEVPLEAAQPANGLTLQPGELLQEPPGLADSPSNRLPELGIISIEPFKKSLSQTGRRQLSEPNRPVSASNTMSAKDAEEEARLYSLHAVQPEKPEASPGLKPGEDEESALDISAGQLVISDVPGLGNVSGTTFPAKSSAAQQGTVLDSKTKSQQREAAAEAGSPGEFDDIFLAGDRMDRNGKPEVSSIGRSSQQQTTSSFRNAECLDDPEGNTVAPISKPAFQSTDPASDAPWSSAEQAFPPREEAEPRSNSTLHRADAGSDSDDSLILNEIRPASPVARGTNIWTGQDEHHLQDGPSAGTLAMVQGHPAAAQLALAHKAGGKSAPSRHPFKGNQPEPGSNSVKPSSFSWEARQLIRPAAHSQQLAPEKGEVESCRALFQMGP